jgi:hypothetical protein
MDFDPNNILPNHLLIDFAATHLYTIGLLYFQVNQLSEKKL